MNIFEKLLNVQIELKAPKGQYNSFGKYKYRSCEDILESLKPVLEKNKLTMFISDDIVCINNRNYVKATVHLVNNEKLGEAVQVSALAREEETKKGMDGSQITGSSSSYARKYALNGMFAIDDTKDSDSTNTHGKDNSDDKEKLIKEITKDITQDDDELLEKMLAYYKKNNLGECEIEELKKIKAKLESERVKRGK